MRDTLVEFADEFGVDPLSHGDGWRQCFRSASGVDYPRDEIWEAVLTGLMDLSERVGCLEQEKKESDFEAKLEAWFRRERRRLVGKGAKCPV